MGKTIKGFKAYDKGMKCRNFQYEEGMIYETKDAKLRKTGFHICVNPLDCLNYYDLTACEFSKAEAIGKIDESKDDSKIATTKIRIGAKLSFKEFVEASIQFILDSCAKKGICNRTKQASSGDWTTMEITGGNSIAVAAGHNTKVKGKKGNWIALSEWKQRPDAKWAPLCVKATQIDGVTIKEDTFYKLENGEFVECE